MKRTLNLLSVQAGITSCSFGMDDLSFRRKSKYTLFWLFPSIVVIWKGPSYQCSRDSFTSLYFTLVVIETSTSTGYQFIETRRNI